MRTIALTLLLAHTAMASPVHEVPVSTKGTRPYITLPSPTLTAVINAEITSTWDGVAAQYRGEVTCGLGTVTDRLVTWDCRGVLSQGGVYAGHAEGEAYVIEADTIRAVTLDMLFAANVAKLDSVTGKNLTGSSCTVYDAKTDAMVFVQDGLELIGSGSNHGCVLEWDQLKKLLVPKSFMFDVLAPWGDRIDDPRALWSKAPARFVAQPDGVLDRASELVWASKDNGADVTFEQAVAFAKDYHAGNHSDWRLPTARELALFSESAGAHREKTDCTKGGYDLLATPLVKLSCGFAWSSTPAGKDMAAFGFISGTIRVLKKTEKKNARALLVRKP